MPRVHDRELHPSSSLLEEIFIFFSSFKLYVFVSCLNSFDISLTVRSFASHLKPLRLLDNGSHFSVLLLLMLIYNCGSQWWWTWQCLETFLLSQHRGLEQSWHPVCGSRGHWWTPHSAHCAPLPTKKCLTQMSVVLRSRILGLGKALLKTLSLSYSGFILLCLHGYFHHALMCLLIKWCLSTFSLTLNDFFCIPCL